MELENNKKKVAVDANDNVMAFQYQSAWRELEVEPYDEAFIGEPIFTEQSINRFKVVDGVVVKKTDEEIKAEPQYSIAVEEDKKRDFVLNTDSEFIRAARELLTVPSIRSLLSADTVKRIEGAEAKVLEIKNKYK